MKRRGIPYILSILLFFGMASGVGTVTVKAEESAVVADESEITIDESSETDASLVVDDSSAIDSSSETDDSEAAAEIEISEADSEDSVASNWYENYEYELDGDYIKLKQYKSDAPDEVYVPKSASINGKTYQTYISAQYNENVPETDSHYSIFAEYTTPMLYKSHVTKITFEKGFKFPEDSSRLFMGCRSLESINLSGVDTSDVKNMEQMFCACDILKKVDLSNFDFTNVTNMRGMFWACRNLRRVDFTDLYLPNVEDMSLMFCECQHLKRLDLSSFKTENEDINYQHFFGFCINLTHIYSPVDFSGDIGLEYTFYDSEGNEYQSIPKGTDQSIKLVKDYDMFSKNGWIQVGYDWKYYIDGELYYGQTIMARGKLINEKDTWYAVTNAKFDDTFTGIARRTTTGWRFAKDGVLNTTYKGLAQTTEGRWYYVSNGGVDTSFTDMIAPATNGKYYYVQKGKPTRSFDGKIAYCPEKKSWYYCSKGRVDCKASGIVAPCTNGKMYYVTRGRIDRTFSGTAKDKNGTSYRVVNGVVK